MSNAKVDVKVDVFQKATEAAKKAGGAYPEAVAEYIQDRLSVVASLAGPTVMARNGLERESLDATMARLKVTENVGPLFNGGDVDVRTLDVDLYQALRKHNPEVLGLRRKRRFT